MKITVVFEKLKHICFDFERYVYPANMCCRCRSSWSEVCGCGVACIKFKDLNSFPGHVLRERYSLVDATRNDSDSGFEDIEAMCLRL